MLHTISDTKIDVEFISQSDAALFWQNGVLLAVENNTVLNDILSKTTHCYVLDNDIVARGLTTLIDPKITIVTMKQVVELTAHYYPQMKW